MKMRAIAPIGIIALLALLGLASCGAEGAEEAEAKSADSPSDVGSKGLIGNKAPDFSIERVASRGPRISLSRLKGKVVVVDFWGTFCEPCKKSFPKLQELSSKYAESGLQIVAISEDEADDKDKIAPFASVLGAKFTIGWDADKSVAKHYNPPTMPSSFVVDRAGHVRFAHAGYHDGDEADLEKEIKELLNENR
jgi:cytochrome c biogenesis protein CcmG, thiol:disulfide interchange protein DsbE